MLAHDAKTSVASLDDLNWTREWDGRLRSRHIFHHVLRRQKGWATVLIVTQEVSQGRVPGGSLRFSLTKFQRVSSLWHLRDRFTLREDDFETLGSALERVLSEARELVEKRSVSQGG